MRKEQKESMVQIKGEKYKYLIEEKENGKKDPLEAAFAQLTDHISTFIAILNKVGPRKINHPIYHNVVKNLIRQLFTTCAWLFNVSAIIEPDWLKKNLLIIRNQLAKPPLPDLIAEAKAQHLFDQLFKNKIEEIDDTNQYMKILYSFSIRFFSIDGDLVGSILEQWDMSTRQKLIFECYEFLAKHNPLVLQHACEYLAFLDESNFVAIAIPELEQINRERRIAEIKNIMETKGIESEERKELERERILLIDEVEKYKKEETDLATEYGDDYYVVQKQNTKISSLIYMKCAWEEFVCSFEYISRKIEIFVKNINIFSQLNNNCLPNFTPIIEIQSLIKKSIDEFQIWVEYAIKSQNVFLNSELLTHIFHNCRASMIKINQISQQQPELLKSLENEAEKKVDSELATMAKKQLDSIAQEQSKIVTDFRLVMKTLPSIESSQGENPHISLSKSFSKFLVSVPNSSSSASSSSSSTSTYSSSLCL